MFELFCMNQCLILCFLVSKDWTWTLPYASVPVTLDVLNPRRVSALVLVLSVNAVEVSCERDRTDRCELFFRRDVAASCYIPSALRSGVTRSCPRR